MKRKTRKKWRNYKDVVKRKKNKNKKKKRKKKRRRSNQNRSGRRK